MKAVQEPDYRRTGRESDPQTPFSTRWYGPLTLLLTSVGMLTLAYAPIKQCYLAWFGLVPWLIVISRCKTYKSAIFWGWLSGTVFFIANMWWMAYVTVPGMIGLMALLASYWGVMAAIVRVQVSGVGFRRKISTPNPEPRTPNPVFIAAAWTSLEFIRGNFIWKGLPWLYLGHTQTPILPVCQIADVFGVYGITFWIVLINTVIASFWLNGFRIRPIARPIAAVVLLTVLIVAYGVWRMKQTVTEPGPVVLVVQSNYPQSNDGSKGATPEEAFRFHADTTVRALSQNPAIDLVVWSETVMPAMNEQTRLFLSGTKYGRGLTQVRKALMDLAGVYQTGLVFGGRFEGDWKIVDDYARPGETRNSAYFIERSGLFSELRYDKIHIVPFGEFLPFRQSLPWVFDLIKKIGLGPPDMDSYQLNAGDESNLTVFPLRRTRNVLDLSTWRFVTPICFEDIDSGLTAKMFRSGQDGKKRADILINLTNDGWFKANEMPQHLQVAVFRSIENRVPTARSVNTGISGFVDSVGRVHDTIAAGTEGSSSAQLMIDPRVTFYTRYGDVFAWICVSATGSAMLLMAINRKMAGSRQK